MNELKETYYQSELLHIHRGNVCGVFINAKPLFVLSIIDGITEHLIKGNKLNFINKEHEHLYEELSLGYEPGKKPSPYVLPFFHLSKESFYHIKWKGEPFVPSHHCHSPSQKYIRENAEYSYLDNALWDLLQDPNVRERYRKAIVDFYLK